VSRAYRPADFEAFLRKHSDSSPSRQSEQADRAQMDRGSRASSHNDRRSLGGKVRRVVLDYELKKELYKKLAQAQVDPNKKLV
jgi:hypothetical protein